MSQKLPRSDFITWAARSIFLKQNQRENGEPTSQGNQELYSLWSYYLQRNQGTDDTDRLNLVQA